MIKVLKRHWIAVLLASIVPAVALWVWFSALSFVPVPWPDDSAFYFVAKDFFRWPPRWVMLSQAPFEPTYTIWNFNTMPLYPILIGLGRFIGIDGSWLLKLWPLGFWAASGSVLALALYRAGLPPVLTAVFTLAYALDPTMRWASVLVRPESLIGLCGVVLVMGLTFKRFDRKDYPWYWDPVAFWLAVGAYAHFNAVHLVLPVLLAFLFQPRRLFDIGVKATMYLSPWIGTVVGHPQLFWTQMNTQWARLAVKNHWLDSLPSSITSMFQALGAPEPWPQFLYWASFVMWPLIGLAVVWGLLVPAARRFQETDVSLVPAAAWVVSSFWLWHNKPEVWFIFYLHQAVWCFAGVAAVKLWQKKKLIAFASLLVPTAACVLIFALVNVVQADHLSHSPSWHWSTYNQFVDCIDQRLTAQETALGHPKPFRVWAPTFPDTTIELSRRHPDWRFTRTNDFYARNHLAIQHGNQVEAVVVTEMINWAERWIDAPADTHPEVSSLWMTWKDYYLNTLYNQPGWKPVRHLCQKARWQAFIYLDTPKATAPPASRLQ